MGWLDKLFGKGGPPRTPVLATVELPPAAHEETVFGDQPMRKAWAEDVLRAEGVPINPHLPMIESEAQITLRRPQEVADRLLALALVAVKGEGLEHDRVQAIIAERDAAALFTPAERAFIDTPEPAMHDRIQFSWRYEAAWVLLWALRHFDGVLGVPRETCDPAAVAEMVCNRPNLAGKGLRRANDILNEADLIYRYHWAVRQAGIDGKDPPAGLNPGVVMERHHALNWLIGYDDGAEWDDVGTDT